MASTSSSSGCYSCPLCEFIARNIPLILSHLRAVHSNDPNFFVTCGINGCCTTYRRFTNLYQHIYRRHRNNIIKTRVNSSQIDSTGNSQGNFEDSSFNLESRLEPVIDHDYDVNEDIQHLIGSDLKAEKKSSALFLLKMKEIHFISQAAVDDIVHGYKELMDHTLLRLKSHARERLSQVSDDCTDVVNNLFCDFDNPFRELDTRYKQEKFFTEELGLVEPTEIPLGDTYYVPKFSGNKRQFVAVQDSFQYVPLLESLKNLLSGSFVLEQVRKPHSRSDDLLEDYCDSQLFKEHPLFSCDPYAIQIIAYYDELEICNPLGSHTKVHKLGVVLYMLGNIHPKYRSSLKAINLAIVVTHPLIEKHGLDAILEPFLSDIRVLSTMGVDVSINGTSHNYKGDLLCFLADNLASNAVGGFKESFSFAFRCCRTCLCPTQDFSECYNEELHRIRSKAEHERHCNSLTGSHDQSSHFSKTYGINRRSCLMDIPNFSMFNGGLPHDMMHDILEGVAQYEIKLLLSNLIAQHYFNLTTFNERLLCFDYGYSEKDHPQIITTRVIRSDDKKLSSTASQTLLLCHILPFLIGDLVPEDNEMWACLLLLLKIIDIVSSPIISKGQCSVLKLLIEDHMKAFKKVYPSATIIPKMHFLIHYPRQIIMIGPMIRSWTMRQEAKLNFFKRSAHLGNFKNISSTLANRHQRWFCYQASSTGGILQPNLECGPSKDAHTLSSISEELKVKFKELLPSISDDTSVSSPTWVKNNGVVYKSHCYLVTGSDGIDPYFGKLINIYVLQEGTVFFEILACNTRYFDDHYHAYVIEESTHRMLISINQLITYPFVLHAHKLPNGYGPFIRVKYCIISI